MRPWNAPVKCYNVQPLLCPAPQLASLAACGDTVTSTPYQVSPYGGPSGISRMGNPFLPQGPATASGPMPRVQLRRPPPRGGSSGYLANEPRHPHAAALQLRAQLVDMRMSVPGSPADVIEPRSHGLRSNQPDNLASKTASAAAALAAMQLRLRSQPEGFEPMRTSTAGDQVAGGTIRHVSSGPFSDNATVSVGTQLLGAVAGGHSGGISLGPSASSGISSRCAPVPGGALRASLLSGGPSRHPMTTYRHTAYARTQSSGMTSRLSSSSSLDTSLPSAAGPGLLFGQKQGAPQLQQPRTTGTGMAGSGLAHGADSGAGTGGPSLIGRDMQHQQPHTHQLLMDNTLEAAETAAAVAAAMGSVQQEQAKGVPGGGHVLSLPTHAHLAQVLAAEGGRRCSCPGAAGTIMEGDESDALRMLAAPDSALNAHTHMAMSQVSGESGSGGLARVDSYDEDEVTHGSARTSARELGDVRGSGRGKGGGGGVLAIRGVSEDGVGGCSTGALGSKLCKALRKGMQKCKGGLAAMLGKKGASGKRSGSFGGRSHERTGESCKLATDGVCV